MTVKTSSESLNKSPTKKKKNEATFVYGHHQKQFRIRTLSAEHESILKNVSVSTSRKISWIQLILAVLICGSQIVTMNLVYGRFDGMKTRDTDWMAEMGGGIWSSVITLFAAVLTLSSLTNAKYWKFHWAFALYITSLFAYVWLLIVQFSGNIFNIKGRLDEALYGDVEKRYENGYNPRKDLSAPMLRISLILNTFMTVGCLLQLVTAFVMTFMTGKAVCCRQSEVHGSLAGKDLNSVESQSANATQLFTDDN